MRISDWSSDVCSSDLIFRNPGLVGLAKGKSRPCWFVAPPYGLLVSSQRCHGRSEEHTSELQSLMRSSYAVFCLKKKNANYDANAITEQALIQAKPTTPKLIHTPTLASRHRTSRIE